MQVNSVNNVNFQAKYPLQHITTIISGVIFPEALSEEIGKTAFSIINKPYNKEGLYDALWDSRRLLRQKHPDLIEISSSFFRAINSAKGKRDEITVKEFRQVGNAIGNNYGKHIVDINV